MAATSPAPAPAPDTIAVTETVRVPIDSVTPHPRNVHVGNVEEIAASLREHRQYAAITVQRSTGHVVKGNHTQIALRSLGAAEVLVSYIDVDDAEALRICLIDNRTAALGYDDQAALAAVLQELQASEAGLVGSGYDDEALAALLESLKPAAEGEEREAARKTLAERFGVAPFSVLDARSGLWQDRKRAWLALGCIVPKIGSAIDSDAWRRASNPAIDSHRKADHMQAAAAAAAAASIAKGETPDPRGVAAMRRLTWAPGDRDPATLDDTSGRIAAATSSGTSIFDPVLIEILLRWFCPAGGRVLDPFAGGTSGGVVASTLGYRFVGVEVRADQVAANEASVAGHGIDAAWVCGDSATIGKDFPGGEPFDFICTDPPYFNLERYSGDARDGTTIKDYAAFREWYVAILKRAASVLAEDRFMAIKIGEARDRGGNYTGIVGDTVRSLQDAGLALYNDLILVTSCGSLPIRAGRAFELGRKAGRTHQNVIVMCKGSWKRAVKALGEVAFTVPIEAELEVPSSDGEVVPEGLEGAETAPDGG